MQHRSRQRITDLSIGWISVTDSLLFGFGLILVLGLSLSQGLTKRNQENQSLQSEQLAITATLDDLRHRHQSLHDERESLTLAKDELTTELENLNQEFVSASEELAAAQNELSEQSDLIERAKKWSLHQKKQIAELEAKRVEVNKQLKDLQTQLDTTKQELDDAEKQREKAQQLEQENKVLQATFEELESKAEARAQSERRMRSELLGLQGSLQRVAILFDTSGSMKGERWQAAIDVLSAWLEHLDMQHCALILFSTEARAFPANGNWLSLVGEDGEQNRRQLVQHVRNLEPTGLTNTLAAFQMAYSYPELDTIILFTDGAPYAGAGGDTSRADPAMIASIYELSRQHPQIPVNAVGIGNYFAPELSQFLLNVTGQTGGNFIGR